MSFGANLEQSSSKRLAGSQFDGRIDESTAKARNRYAGQYYRTRWIDFGDRGRTSR